jgi:hypothetical protein
MGMSHASSVSDADLIFVIFAHFLFAPRNYDARAFRCGKFLRRPRLQPHHDDYFEGRNVLGIGERF